VLAARSLFAERGYGRVSMADIASQAGVSVKTIYSSVGAKADLLTELNQLINEAGMVGPINEEIAQSDDPVEILRLAARLRRRLMEEAWDIVLMAAHAAVADDDAKAAYEASQQGSFEGAKRIVDRLLTVGATLSMERDQAVDTLHTLMHWRLYIRLVAERGWTPDQFEQWQGDVLIGALLAER
jgi:AcrR family transcriptional regulator